jgi:hypothetical protein
MASPPPHVIRETITMSKLLQSLALTEWLLHADSQF